MKGLNLTICLLAFFVASTLAVPRLRLAFNEEPEVTEPPGDDDIKCEDGIEFIAHLNCSLFYQCDHGLAKLKSCADTLYFSPAINGCDFPRNVPECVDGTRGTERPTEATSPQTPKPTDAPTDKPTDAPTEAPTDAPTDKPTDAPTDKPTDAPTDAPTDKPTDAPTEPPTDAPTEAPTNPPTEPTTPAPICKFPDQVYNIPVPMNCSAFIRCIYGTPIPSTCAEKLLFDPVLLKCNLAENVNCDETTPTPAPTDAPTPNPICPDQDSVYQVPYIGNCSLYYICVKGRPNLQECAPKLLFDVVSTECTREENAQCYVEPTEAPTTTVATTTTRRPVVCEPEGVYFTEFPGDCSKYVLCSNGVPILQSCASQTVFNPNINKCVREEDYYCPYNPTPAPTDAPTNAPTNAPTDAPTEPPTDAPTEPPTDAPTEPPTEAPTDAPTNAPTEPPTDAPTEAPTERPTTAAPICVDPTSIYNIAIVGNCKEYIRCVFGEPENKVCPQGTLFHPVDLKCHAEEDVQCEKPTTPKPKLICEDPERIYNTFHPFDCSLYYFCVYGSYTLESCAPKTLFDGNDLECVREEFATCYEEPTKFIKLISLKGFARIA